MANFAYAFCPVAAPASSTLEVFDLSLNLLVASVTTGNNGWNGQISPDNKKIWVSNLGDNTVSVVDVATNTVTTTIAGFNSPAGIEFSADGTTAYVLGQGLPTHNFIQAVDTTSYALGTLYTTGLSGVQQINRSPVTPSLFVHSDQFNVQQVTLPAGTLAAPVGGGNGDSATGAFRNDGVYYLQAQTLGGSANQLNIAANTSATLNLGGGRLYNGGIVFDPNGLVYYAANATGGVSIVNASTFVDTGTVLATGGAGNPGVGPMSLTGDGTQIAVVNFSNTSLYTIALPSLTIPAPASLIAAGSGACRQIVTTPKSITPPAPPKVFRPMLFVPRKGLREYQGSDFAINWSAIERWASGQGKPVIFPFRGQQMPTEDELDANWHRMEIWAASGVNPPPDGVVAPLLIQRKHSLAAGDLTINFLRIQDWANGQ